MAKKRKKISRRKFIAYSGGIAAGTAAIIARRGSLYPPQDVAIIKAASYSDTLRDKIDRGFKILGIGEQQIKGKTILLKPNLVEPHAGRSHVNTNPLLVQAAAESFLAHGAAKVTIAEGAGHRRDSYLVLELTGLGDVLYQDKLPFIDLNYSDTREIPNLGGWGKLDSLFVPQEVLAADIVVSMPKLKTHHWAGATLSMKNFFGIMPGSHYGWPKNILHHAGLQETILDINASIKPDFAIVDGIVGMEGDGPIMGEAKRAEVLIMGSNLTAVDATCARIMGMNPEKIGYLAVANNRYGPIAEDRILQRGDKIADVKTDFKLLEHIPAQKILRG